MSDTFLPRHRTPSRRMLMELLPPQNGKWLKKMAFIWLGMSFATSVEECCSAHSSKVSLPHTFGRRVVGCELRNTTRRWAAELLTKLRLLRYRNKTEWRSLLVPRPISPPPWQSLHFTWAATYVSKWLPLSFNRSKPSKPSPTERPWSVREKPRWYVAPPLLNRRYYSLPSSKKIMTMTIPLPSQLSSGQILMIHHHHHCPMLNQILNVKASWDNLHPNADVEDWSDPWRHQILLLWHEQPNFTDFWTAVATRGKLYSLSPPVTQSSWSTPISMNWRILSQHFLNRSRNRITNKEPKRSTNIWTIFSRLSHIVPYVLLAFMHACYFHKTLILDFVLESCMNKISNSFCHKQQSCRRRSLRVVRLSSSMP